MKRTQNTKTENLLMGIVSGLLTSSISKYIQQDTQSIIWRVLLTLGIFVLIWVLLSFVFPELLTILKRIIRFRFRRVYSSKEIVNTFYSTKNKMFEIIERYNKMTSYSNRISMNSVVFYSDLLVCTNDLHRVFCGKQKIQKATVQSVFRDYTVVKDIKTKISYYEYEALIRSINELVDQLHYNDNGKIIDYNHLKAMINELKNVLH